jgi:hypothetical protein
MGIAICVISVFSNCGTEAGSLSTDAVIPTSKMGVSNHDLRTCRHGTAPRLRWAWYRIISIAKCTRQPDAITALI